MKEVKEETDQALKALASEIVNLMKKEPDENIDPFDFYVQRVQLGFFAKEEEFSARFIKGYHALMRELSLIISKEKKDDSKADTRDA